MTGRISTHLNVYVISDFTWIYILVLEAKYWIEWNCSRFDFEMILSLFRFAYIPIIALEVCVLKIDTSGITKRWPIHCTPYALWFAVHPTSPVWGDEEDFWVSSMLHGSLLGTLEEFAWPHNFISLCDTRLSSYVNTPRIDPRGRILGMTKKCSVHA